MIYHAKNFGPKMYGLAVIVKKVTFSENHHISKTLRDIDLILFVKDAPFKNTDKFFRA